MGDDARAVARDEWQEFLSLLTAEHGSDDVTIEVVSDSPDDEEPEIEALPLNYIEYDTEDDMIVVGVGGRGRRFPVVLRHFVHHPRRVVFDRLPREGVWALDILDGEGAETIVASARAPA